jgi:acyl-CoA thioesterase I
VNSRHMGQPPPLQWATTALLMLAALASPGFASAAAHTAPPASPHVVLVMGDSLSAAHDLAESQGWVALTAPLLGAHQPAWTIINASISGETSAGGAARITHELGLHPPGVLVIELGANDALRGLPLQQMRTNLAAMIDAGHAAHVKVLLIGMRIPPNYGPAYTQQFAQSFGDLARQHDAVLLPFLLEPIALDRTAFQDDGLHPVARVEPKLRDWVWRVLEPMLR